VSWFFALINRWLITCSTDAFFFISSLIKLISFSDVTMNAIQTNFVSEIYEPRRKLCGYLGPSSRFSRSRLVSQGWRYTASTIIAIRYSRNGLLRPICSCRCTSWIPCPICLACQVSSLQVTFSVITLKNRSISFFRNACKRKKKEITKVSKFLGHTTVLERRLNFHYNSPMLLDTIDIIDPKTEEQK